MTQFMSSHGLRFLLVISSIFWSKNSLFVFLTISLNFFQLFRLLDHWYMSRSLQQLLSHQALEYLEILTFLEFFYYELLTFVANELTVSSRKLMLMIKSVLRFFIEFLTSIINYSSSLLFLIRTRLYV